MMVDFQDDIKKSLEVLKNGGILLYPTDTVWGLGCDATNEKAVERIYALKKRSDSKSMLVLIENPNLLLSYVDEVPDIAWDLLELSVKPTTIIYDRAKNLASNLVATDGSIGIRITNEAFSSELIRRFRRPIVSTSANISGCPTPRNFAEITPEIVAAVDYAVNFRQDDLSAPNPSSIIKLGAGGLVKIIRE